MNIHYKLKNFRVFGEKGAEIDIAPITILTGCNSSGKSSITKSLLLLGNYCEMLDKSRLMDENLRFDFSKAKIDFQQLNTLFLGNFDKVINSNNTDGVISFEYKMHSHFLSSDITVRLYFIADKSDNRKDGYLSGYTISDKDDNCLFASKEHGLHYDNLNYIIHAFHDFYFYYQLRKHFSDFRNLHRRDSSSAEKLNALETEINLFLKDKSKTLRQDLAYCQSYYEINEIFNEYAEAPLKKLEEEGTLFYLNNWTWFKSLSPNNIKNEIKNTNIIKVDDKFRELTELVVNDFIASGDSDFINYYLKKEAEFLEEKIQSDEDDFDIRSYDSVYLHQDFCDKKEDKVIYLPDGTEYKRAKQKEEFKDKTYVDFDMVYQMAVTIDYYIDPSKDDYYYPKPGNNLKFEHKLFSPFNKFAKRISDEALCPLFLKRLRYISTSRVTVQRIYTYQSNEFSKLIEEYNDNKRNRNYYPSRYDEDIFINKWIKAFKIGDKLELEYDEEGIGTKIKINKGKYSRLLADEGYGVTQLVSILLQIEVAIQKSSFTLMRLSPDINLQELFRGSFREGNIIIEEPEIHLHPKYQSLLADMLTDAYLNYNIHFIIETHSEYLIRRLQNIIGDSKSGLKVKDISINYIYSQDDPEYDEKSPIKKINVRSDGRLEDSFGKGFFDEADRQVEDLVNRKIERHGRFSKK